MDGPVIQTQSLTKSYGTRVAVNRLNLTVDAKQVHGFLGPNGAGKTTIANVALRDLGVTLAYLAVFLFLSWYAFRGAQIMESA